MWPQRFVTDLLLWIRLPFRCFKEIAIESTVDLAFPVREEPCGEPCTSCLSPLQSQEVGTGIPSAKVRSGGTKSLSHFLKKCPPGCEPARTIRHDTVLLPFKESPFPSGTKEFAAV